MEIAWYATALTFCVYPPPIIPGFSAPIRFRHLDSRLGFT